MNISEGILDPIRDSYDQDIFANPLDSKPILRGVIKKQILDISSDYSQWGGIKMIYIIGSILSKRYTPSSDIDVTLIMDPFSEGAYETARQYAGSNWDSIMAEGTSHPINHFVRTEFDLDNADHVYDVLKDEWIKQNNTFDIPPSDMAKYYSNFNKIVREIDITKSELKRDIVDYNALLSLPQQQIKRLEKIIQHKLEKIDKAAKELAFTYKVIHVFRKAAFENVSIETLQRYRSKNLLPANILYKLLERYHYTKLLSAIRDILIVGDNKIDSPEEVSDLEKVLTAEGIDLYELTTSGAAGSIQKPLGWRRKKSKKQKKSKRDSMYNL